MSNGTLALINDDEIHEGLCKARGMMREAKKGQDIPSRKMKTNNKLNILLVNPPSPYLENDAAYPPMGLMYVAAILERLGHTVKISDLTAGGELPEDTWRYGLVGITCVTPNFNTVKKLCENFRVPIMIGGPHPTFMPSHVITEIEKATAVIGEAESTLPQIISDRVNGWLKPYYQCTLPNTMEIPMPARHLVDLDKYSPGGKKATPVYATRGCPYNCAFCSKLAGRTYRKFPVSRVLDEIQVCIEYGFRNIVFGDDNINADPRYLEYLLTAIKKETDLNVRFRLNMDSRHITKPLLDLAYEAGCTEISMGIESGSQKILDAMNKNATVEENRDAIRLVKEAGIVVKTYLMVNFPGETMKTVKETVKFIEETRPDEWMVSAFAPLPGSDTWEDPCKYGITWRSENFDDYYLVGKDGKFNPCFTTDNLTVGKQIEHHKFLKESLEEIS